MPRNRPSYFTLGSTHLSELHGLAQRGAGFFHIGGSEIPSIIPEELRQKWNSAVVVVSPTAGAMAVIGHRIDQTAGKMDHDPFLIRMSGSTPHGKGVLIHHASFPGRSTTLPSSSTPENYYRDRDHPLFGLSSGSTSSLPAPLYRAFNIAQLALGSTGAT